MGYYVEGPALGKVGYLVRLGAKVTVPNPSWKSIPEDKALIIVVNNGPFEAAALAFSENELLAFTDPGDPRPKTFLLLDKKEAHRLANYEEAGAHPRRRQLR